VVVDIDERVTRAGGPAVSAFLASASAAWSNTLGRNLSGVYVHGSLATGAFNPRTSDVDVVIATRALTDAADNERLHALHLEMLGWADESWPERLEAVFVPNKVLTASEVPAVAVAAVHPDEGFTVEPLGPEFAIQKYLLRTYGITLFGRDVRKIVRAVSTGELRAAQIGTLRVSWLPQLEFPGRFLDRGYQAYAVLTMCRALCLLAIGKVVTKPEAAAWALRGPYLESWRSLVRSAIAYPGGRQPDQRAATVEFVRFTLEEAEIGHAAPSS
jgi:predicted nucleotidyltransferase